MPFANHHACRLRQPGRYSRFRYAKNEREHNGKKYDVVYGKVKGEDTWEEQAYRYPKETWSVGEARRHCKSHKGILFEPATDSSSEELREHSDVAGCSPFWAIYRPALERMIAETAARAARGPAQKAADAGLPIRSSDGLAVVSVRGVLEKRRSWMLDLFGGTSYLSIRAALEAALADKSIEEIMLLVDSPGGSVDGLAELGDFMREARATKPITVFIDGMGASAAYYLASQATRIVAGRTALAGSIGTILVMYDYSKAFEEAGIKPVVVATGEFKSTGVPGTEITDAQKKELQEIVDFYEADFEHAIVQGRRMDPKAVKELATGRVWDAPEAMELGLVDALGTYQSTVAELFGHVKRRARGRGARAYVELAERK